jgi:hypothetical protein
MGISEPSNLNEMGLLSPKEAQNSFDDLRMTIATKVFALQCQLCCSGALV